MASNGNHALRYVAHRRSVQNNRPETAFNKAILQHLRQVCDTGLLCFVRVYVMYVSYRLRQRHARVERGPCSLLLTLPSTLRKGIQQANMSQP